MLTKLYVKSELAIRSFMKDRQGVTAIEYAIVGVAIAAIVAAVFSSTGTGGLKGALDAAITKINTTISSFK